MIILYVFGPPRTRWLQSGRRSRRNNFIFQQLYYNSLQDRSRVMRTLGETGWVMHAVSLNKGRSSGGRRSSFKAKRNGWLESTSFAKRKKVNNLDGGWVEINHACNLSPPAYLSIVSFWRWLNLRWSSILGSSHFVTILLSKTLL